MRSKSLEFCCWRLGKDDNRTVASRIHNGWRKVKELSDTLCCKTLSRRLKGRLYKACVSVMRYGAECLTTKKVDTRRYRQRKYE